MNSRKSMRPLRWIAVGCLIVLGGCGQAEYEARMKSVVDQLEFGSRFLNNLQPQPTEIPPTNASVKLPMLIDQYAESMTEGTTIKGQRVSRDRLQPPFMELPGYQFTYEKVEDIGDRVRHPLYVYFALVEAPQMPAEQLMGVLRTAAAKSFSGATWMDKTLPTPNQQQINFKVMILRGNQKFDLAAANDPPENLDGRMDLYLYSTPEHHFLIGFRTTDPVAQMTKFFELAELSMGTFEAP